MSTFVQCFYSVFQGHVLILNEGGQYFTFSAYTGGCIHNAGVRVWLGRPLPFKIDIELNTNYAPSILVALAVLVIIGLII